MLKRIKPQTVNPFTMMAKPYEKYDETETEDETTDHSEDPLSSSDKSSTLSNWNAGVEIPTIESSFRTMRVDIITNNGNLEDLEPHRSNKNTPSRRSCLKAHGRKRRQRIQYTGEMKLRLPMCNTPLRKRTCVSFKPSVLVRHVVPVHKIIQEKESLWFQADEYSRIEKRCKHIAQKVMRGENFRGRTLCSRGLESIMCPQQRTNQKFDGWRSVFNEQRMQRGEGHYDEEKMRKMYEPASSESMIEAHRRGLVDEKDAQRYLQLNRPLCLKPQC